MTSLWLQQKTPIETDEFVADAEYHEIIVGAGLTGLVTAVLLARAGRRVAVLESREVGAGATGNTTAKLSQLQGTRLSTIEHTMYPAVMHAHAQSNRAAFDWVAAYLGEHGIPHERRDAVTYAATADGTAAAHREFELALEVGLDVRWQQDAGLPFRTYGAAVLPNQIQFDPLDVLAALAAELRSLGGAIIEHTRVVGVRASAPARVTTERGELWAQHVVLATGTPILDRGLYFAKLAATRSYAAAFDVPEGGVPLGMFLGVETPTRSIRDSNGMLLTGGNGHPVGRNPSPARAVQDLAEWTTTHWPSAVRTAAWSAQDYRTPHHVPFVGALPRGRGRILLATGYEKWGMTSAVSSAMTIVADLLGGQQHWQKVLRRRLTMPRAIASGIGENLATGVWYATGWATTMTRRLPDAPPAEGRGVTGRVGLTPVAASTVDGRTCEFSAVCPHLGAIVTWNDAERSWDCPAHGSRFSADGRVLDGPTKRDLRPRRTLSRRGVTGG